MYLLDTNVVSQTSEPKPDPRATAFLQSVSVQFCYLSVITIEEILVGIRRHAPGPRRRELEDWYEKHVLGVYRDRILTVDMAVADACADMILNAKKHAKNPGISDALIAATARVHRLTVVTFNRTHFDELGAQLEQL